jgi:hypothetical protein
MLLTDLLLTYSWLCLLSTCLRPESTNTVLDQTDSEIQMPLVMLYTCIFHSHYGNSLLTLVEYPLKSEWENLIIRIL